MIPRVLMVVPHAWHTGATRSVVNLVAGAQDAGFAPIVAVLRDGPIADELADLGVVPHRVLRGRRLRSASGTLRALRGLADLGARVRPDLVYASEAMGHVFAAPLARRLGTPAVWRQPSWPAFSNPLDVTASAAGADAIVVASRAVARAQRRMSRRTPLHLIPPGIDLERTPRTDAATLRAQAGAGPGTPLVGIVGRLERWKGQDHFLHAAALALAARPGLRFAVVGGVEAGEDTRFAADLHALARRLGIADRVTFTGATDDVAGWMQALDVVVNASAREPFGLVVLEALAARRAVVAVAEGGPADVLVHDRTGVLLPRREAPLMADAIVRLADDPALRTRLGGAGALLVTGVYGRERMAADFGTLFRRVAGGRPVDSV